MCRKINRSLLPVKGHYFFFLAAMGPILPSLPVIGKQLGISKIAIGCVNAVLPLAFIIIKPLFGFLIDFFQKQRKLIFLLILSLTTVTYGLMAFIPNTSNKEKLTVLYSSIKYCSTEILSKMDRNCSLTCKDIVVEVMANSYNFCFTGLNSSCLEPEENYELTCPRSDANFYLSTSFWAYVILMSIGTIGYNVSNSVTDAICFDILGAGGQKNYGYQRVWGTIGFGLTALLSGYCIDYISEGYSKDYTPAYLLTVVLMLVDIICCCKLNLPPFPKTESIIHSIGSLIKQPAVAVFLFYATLVGISDAAMIFYLLWYLEDLAEVTNQMSNIKLLEGLTVAAETLFGEVVFFSVSGKIISKFGYGHCLTMCFALYALRLGLVSYLTSPWWVLPIELVMQGPTYALCYTTVVGYASEITPPGTSGTMQGLVAGMDDGFGYAIGSILGGFLYSVYGGSWMFFIFSIIAGLASITHCIIYMKWFKNATVHSKDKTQYEPTAMHELQPLDSSTTLPTMVTT